MKWAEISIQTTHEATEAVADLFHELGASGVVIEDPELVSSYRRAGIWDYCDIPEDADPEIVTVKAYLPADDQLDDKLRQFEQQVNDLGQHDLDKGNGCIQCREVQDEDWASCWKEYYHPIKIGEKIVIKPSWEVYASLPDELVIELDPGMAFGTGTHHTTAMCVRCLEDLVKPGSIVFDIGTGSGILAIAAAKLGAAKVLAVDLDPVAVNIAQENVIINHLQPAVSVSLGDLLTGVQGQADVIVANIVADVIIGMLPDVPERLTPGGYFCASGIISDRMADVTEAMLRQGLIVEKVVEEGGWAAMIASKGGL